MLSKVQHVARRAAAPISYRAMSTKFNFSIDRGGTFTDLFGEVPEKYVDQFGARNVVYKLLSVDAAYPDAPREGIRRILELVTGRPYPSEKLLDSSEIGAIRMGTTVATNALLEREGKPVALLITKGFKDLLHIGNQSRPKIFDLAIKRPEVLYEKVFEVGERVRIAKWISKEDQTGKHMVVGSTNEELLVEKPLDLSEVRAILENVQKSGIDSIAVCFLHSYTFANHEREVEKLARQMGFTDISLSSELMPTVRIVPRGDTTCADAYLTPCIQQYVKQFISGFDGKFEENVALSFMQSDGGLCSTDHFSGFRAVLSGPAGGVVGYAQTSFDKEENRTQVIGFDMGGTSTDVSRYDGSYEHVFENTTAGVRIQAPQLDINTVAAGGGSCLTFEAGMFHCGPKSVGATPGPVCYLKQEDMKDKMLAVTDANLVLGRLCPEFFPNIFGPKRDEPLGKASSIKAFENMTRTINEWYSKRGIQKVLNKEEVAHGFLQVANEAMCRPIRELTMAKGYDITEHCLATFGGAGGQHACAVARALGIRKVLIHKYAGILSAYGMGLADIVHEEQEASAKRLEEQDYKQLSNRLDALASRGRQFLETEGFSREAIVLKPFLRLRFEGTDTGLMIPGPSDEEEHVFDSYLKSFLERYQREFGFVLDRPVLVDDIRVRCIGTNLKANLDAVTSNKNALSTVSSTKCHFMNEETGKLIEMDTSVYNFEDFSPFEEVVGPAIILQSTSTILVEPNCVAKLTKKGDLEIQVGKGAKSKVSTKLDLIQLAIFGHRFMSIAEQMGRTLQRTSISTNIKERLDFSCAIFGPDGGLVANAPHLPVHLGSMQEAVRFQTRARANDVKQGDVFVSNHPLAGGTHLPDITVMTPVFASGAEEPVFWVASRGHHADIGGISPGSMPPFSKYLWQEGTGIQSMKLVEGGVFQEERITEMLCKPTGPGCSGTRNLSENLSDLKAQVAANQRGIQLVQELIEHYSLPVVQAYMGHIQDAAESSVRTMLQTLARNKGIVSGFLELQTKDFMDDGSPICLSVSINPENGSALFDFTGTGPQMYGNCNAPKAVTFSAIIYCLRCMVDLDIPLNQGCLKPIEVRIPENCLLNPAAEAGVVGGNVLTSQRVTDVIFKAFEAAAASQGCMNNLTFGDDSFGYYETIAGGHGAGPTWNGQSGVHTHMTNTRITDPEILERRYPVVLREFGLRAGSGGKGQFNGGDGCVRTLEFTRPLSVGILSERRCYAPFGLQGGEDGQSGINHIIKRDRTILNLGAKAEFSAEVGDSIRILSPGGGGYGSMDLSPPQVPKKGPSFSKEPLTSGSLSSYKQSQTSN